MNKIWIFAILILCGCAVKKPDVCEKERIECINECNNTLCVSKCEQIYNECIKTESINGLGTYLYNTIYLNNDKGVK